MVTVAPYLLALAALLSQGDTSTTMPTSDGQALPSVSVRLLTPHADTASQLQLRLIEALQRRLVGRFEVVAWRDVALPLAPFHATVILESAQGAELWVSTGEQELLLHRNVAANGRSDAELLRTLVLVVSEALVPTLQAAPTKPPTSTAAPITAPRATEATTQHQGSASATAAWWQFGMQVGAYREATSTPWRWQLGVAGSLWPGRLGMGANASWQLPQTVRNNGVRLHLSGAQFNVNAQTTMVYPTVRLQAETGPGLRWQRLAPGGPGVDTATRAYLNPSWGLSATVGYWLADWWLTLGMRVDIHGGRITPVVDGREVRIQGPVSMSVALGLVR